MEDILISQLMGMIMNGEVFKNEAPSNFGILVTLVLIVVRLRKMTKSIAAITINQEKQIALLEKLTGRVDQNSQFREKYAVKQEL